MCPSIESSTSEDNNRAFVTVDVWDTLLRRRCHPDAVKLHVCRYLLNHFVHALPTQYHDHWELLKARQKAEKLIADSSRESGFDDEYLHLDVYQRWIELINLNVNDIPAEIREQLPAILDRLELDQEDFVSYSDPYIVETISQMNAAPVFFLSDFYLPSSHIKKLLVNKGLSKLVEEGVVSCEVKLNKRSGRLFQHIHEMHDVRPEEHIHIGDSKWSDVDPAEKLGIRAIHYLPDSEQKKRKTVEAGFSAREKYLRDAASTLVAESTRERSSDEPHAKVFYGLGRKSSLLLFSFILQVMERSVADRVDKLFFFTREGEFFLHIYRLIKEQNALGYPVPECELLDVSRVATFAGSLREISCNELMRIWNQYSTQSVAALFSSLDIDPTPFKEMIHGHGIDLQENICYPWLDRRIQALFTDHHFIDAVKVLVGEKKDALLAYLASKDLPGGNEVIGIVDIGWRGTIQDNLAYALPNTKFHGYYFALNKFLNIQPPNCAKSAFGPNINSGSTPFDFILDSVAPIEMLCNSPNGSTKSYTLTEAGVQVSKIIDASENRVHHAYIRHFQEGVLDSIPYWASFSRTHAYPAKELVPESLKILKELIQKPHPLLANAFFELNHNETFGTGCFSDKSKLPTIAGLLFSVFSARYRTLLGNFIREVGWVHGLLANPRLSLPIRVAVGALYRAAKIKARVHTLVHTLRS